MANELQSISILMPINRDNSYFNEALDSINDASRGLIVELVVICNQMTKNEFTEIEIKISRYLKIPFQIYNLGEVTLVDALNFGIKQCNYDLIARFDSDDVMDSKRLQIQSKYMTANIETGVMGSWVKVLKDSKSTNQIVKFPVRHSEIIELLKFGNTFSHPSIIFRKNVIEGVGGYSNDFEYAEDFELWLRLSRITNLYNYPDTLISYRVHKTQTSVRRKKVQIESLKNLIIREAIINNEIHGRLSINDQNINYEKISDENNLLMKSRILQTMIPIHSQSYRNVKCRQNIALLRYNLPIGFKNFPIFLLYFSRAILLNPVLFLKFFAIRKL
jgi:hypothetical protein